MPSRSVRRLVWASATGRSPVGSSTRIAPMPSKPWVWRSRRSRGERPGSHGEAHVARRAGVRRGPTATPIEGADWGSNGQQRRSERSEASERVAGMWRAHRELRIGNATDPRLLRTSAECAGVGRVSTAFGRMRSAVRPNDPPLRRPSLTCRRGNWGSSRDRGQFGATSRTTPASQKLTNWVAPKPAELRRLL
jgi:hypothetical protein